MNAKVFSEAIGELDIKYVNEALNYKKKTGKPAWIKWVAMAACLCLAVAGAMLYAAENRYPVKNVVEKDATAPGEIADLPHWEDMPIYQQYREITLNALTYITPGGVIPADRLGEKIADTVAKGQDYYAQGDGEKYCDAGVYEIQDISSQCAVAIQYEGDNTYYAAVNETYRPETLGQFIEDLDLQNTLTVNWAGYEYQKPLGETASIRFEGLDINRVWEMLLADTDAVNEYDDGLGTEVPEEILGLSVSLPLLGYENVSLSIREGGYIITNILATGKMFYIGEENTDAFVDYVLKECTGYEIVYTTNPDDGENEAVNSTEGDTDIAYTSDPDEGEPE